ncbi:retrotransposon hot spot (RHS) protein, putative [Trypanosoma cruzi marinkellei]|uniref:Retrotransposon hot spot (RHS) protein, putative n=1 Tax=Trypanosoma cruzi marinkellei TaxID=85056 RepID=K2LX90_TRYCR|nr:retrotransposon hot spot (RHS) protein, putative [Trypanosoma cruzi marinkellei]
MDAREGKPKQSWTYKEVNYILEKDDGVEQSGAAPPRLMVLTSDKGWPYSWKEDEFTRECYVNCEVDRVWQIVSSDLTKWFSNFDLSLNPPPMPRVLIGTPGIGKSMAAGSYLLYQLLHYDIKKLQVVVHCFGETAYVFDKTAQTVTQYEGAITSKSAVRSFWQRGMKGYIIYDVAKKGTPTAKYFAPASGWGMIVVSSPKVSNYDKWEKQLKARRIIMNCPDEMDVKAMSTWMKQGVTTDKQAKYWEMVKKHMYFVGPILRYIFDEESFNERSGAVKFALNSINELTVKEYFSRGGELPWYSEDPSHKLVKIVREIYADSEMFFNAPICVYLREETFEIFLRLTEYNSFLKLLLASKDIIFPIFFEYFALKSFMESAFVKAMSTKLTELEPPTGRQAKPCVLKLNLELHPKGYEDLVPSEYEKKKRKIKYGVLYKPWVTNFPLVDASFFMESNPMTLVGLQMTTAGAHHTKASTVKQFDERLEAYFEDLEELSREMSWEIIYVQHTDSKPITGWQRCDVVDADNVSEDEKEIMAFWNGKVHQYQFLLTPDFVWKMREMTIQ